MNAPLSVPQTLRRKQIRRAEAPRSAGLRQYRQAKLDKSANQNERAMLIWLDTAARYHTDPVRDVLVALKTIEGDVSDDAGVPPLYVWEVAWRRERDGIKWQFLVWDVSGYGVRFLDCASRDEAMALYNLPLEQGIAAAQHAPGVYLRARHRKVWRLCT